MISRVDLHGCNDCSALLGLPVLRTVKSPFKLIGIKQTTSEFIGFQRKSKLCVSHANISNSLLKGVWFGIVIFFGFTCKAKTTRQIMKGRQRGWWGGYAEGNVIGLTSHFNFNFFFMSKQQQIKTSLGSWFCLPTVLVVMLLSMPWCVSP